MNVGPPVAAVRRFDPKSGTWTEWAFADANEYELAKFDSNAHIVKLDERQGAAVNRCRRAADVPAAPLEDELRRDLNKWAAVWSKDDPRPAMLNDILGRMAPYAEALEIMKRALDAVRSHVSRSKPDVMTINQIVGTALASQVKANPRKE